VVVASCGWMVLVDRLVSALPFQTPLARAVFCPSPQLRLNFTALLMLHPPDCLCVSSAHFLHCPPIPPRQSCSRPCLNYVPISSASSGLLFLPTSHGLILSHRTIVRPSRLIHVRPHDQKPERLPNPRTLSVPGSPSVSPPAPTTAVRPSRPRWTDSEVNRASSRRTVRRRWRR